MSQLYIAGPMTGYPGHNLESFDHASKILKSAGYDTVSPADMHRKFHTEDRAEIASRDLNALLEGQGIALLPGFEHSPGARMEFFTARFLGHPVVWGPTGVELHPGVMEKKIAESILTRSS